MVALAASRVAGVPAVKRLPAIDWLRGLVMVLMTIDHASDHFNGRHLMTDAVFMYTPGTVLPMDLFLSRWITHLCAPTFVFLAGAALSMSVERQLSQSVPARAIDCFIVTRGLILLALEPLWMSWMFATGIANPLRVERGLAACGLLSLGLFAIVRGVNGYGNMGRSCSPGSSACSVVSPPNGRIPSGPSRCWSSDRPRSSFISSTLTC